MSVITYKCPNCDAELVFRPQAGDFGCEYCGAAFSEAQLLALAKAQGIGAGRPEPGQGPGDPVRQAVVYTCPSCGAELVTSDTTAATACFYCHNPVVLGGRLSGEYAPDCLIPFAIGKDEVRERLLRWCGKKKFIQRDFCSEMQLEKLAGVYFPFWLVDGRADVHLSAQGRSLRVWMAGDIEYTETSTYALERGGTMDFSELTLRALDREDVRLLEGLYPYDLSGLKPFNMGYLSGFLAEKRSVEKERARPAALEAMRAAAESLLRDTTAGYGAVSTGSLTATPAAETWRYALLPAWMLTYTYNGSLYYFVMNGQTGKIAGRVPASPRKLWYLFGGVAAGVSLLSLLAVGGLL